MLDINAEGEDAGGMKIRMPEVRIPEVRRLTD